MSQDVLREEIRFLGDLLGKVIKVQEGGAFLALEEEIRQVSQARRRDGETSVSGLRDLLENCDEESLFALCRAFSLFFDLANLAEDRHRTVSYTHLTLPTTPYV